MGGVAGVVGHGGAHVVAPHDRTRDEAGGGEAERGSGEHAAPRARGIGLERDEQIGHRRVAIARPQRQPAEDDPAEPAGDARVRRRRGRERELAGWADLERPLAVERLVQRDAEAELIAGRADGLGALRLGRHVHRRAEDAARDREVLVERAVARAARAERHRGVAGGAREAEVEHARAAVAADEHVVRLEVAVDDAGVVGGGEAAARPEEQRDDVAPRARPGGEPLLELDAVDELHRDPHAIAGRPDVEHADDVGVREARERLGLALEATLGAGRRAVAVRLHELDRDAAIELRIVGRVDDSHAARAELVEHDVASDHAAARQLRGLGCTTPFTARRLDRGLVVARVFVVGSDHTSVLWRLIS
jgi:hypothetical protein